MAQRKHVFSDSADPTNSKNPLLQVADRTLHRMMMTLQQQSKDMSQELDHWSKLRAQCSCTSYRKVNIQYT